MHIHILHIKHIYKSKFRKKNASEKAELQKADMYMYVYVQTYIGFYDSNVFSSSILTWKWNDQNQALNLMPALIRKIKWYCLDVALRNIIYVSSALQWV